VKTLTARHRVFALALTVCTVLVVAASASLATANPTVPTTRTSATVVGRQLYRRYCGQCHALAKALAAGFGNDTTGIGRNGGPSFNDLRVSYAASVTAVTEPTGGHEMIRTLIPPKQLTELATYIARTTSGNPIPALSTDG
jgi:mono/diheme cytochrome c family protein